MKRFALILSVSVFLISAPVFAATPSFSVAEVKQLRPRLDVSTKGQATSVPGQVLVKFTKKPTVAYESELSLSVPFTSFRIRLRDAGFATREFPGVTRINKQLKAKSVRLLGTSGAAGTTALIDLPTGINRDAAIAQYGKQSGVEIAEPNYLVRGQFLPNDPYFQRNAIQDYQWNFYAIKMPQAWDFAPQGGSPSVKVAVIDSGVAFENFGSFVKAPEFANTTFVSPHRFESLSHDCTTPLPTPISDTHPNDDEGHGTHVSGTIAQTTNNAAHAAGIAFHVSIMPIKALTSCTTGANTGSALGSTSDIIAGINYAIANGAKVINLSLGMDIPDPLLHNAITAATNAGVTVIAASGNGAARTSSPAVGYPAAFPEVIAVGATRFDNIRAEYSQYGPELDLVAPGGQVFTDSGPQQDQCVTDAPDLDTALTCIFSDQNHDLLPDGIVQQTIVPGNPGQFTSILPPSLTPFSNFRCVATDFTSVWVDQGCGLENGTSMATPHVSAAAALLLSVNPSLSPTQVKNFLTSTASKAAIPGYNTNEYGAGLLDVGAAMAAAAGGGGGTPTPTPTPPAISPTPTPAVVIDSECELLRDGRCRASCVSGESSIIAQCPNSLLCCKVLDSSPTPRPTGWTTTEKYQLLVGDVNNDNKITIDDVSLVLAKYTDFSVPVPAGTPEDLNADGAITIDDVALVLLNYTDFSLPGD